MRRTGGWTTTLLLLAVVIIGGGMLVVYEMWSGSRDEVVHLAADEMMTPQPAHGEATNEQLPAARVGHPESAGAARMTGRRSGGDVDAVSQAIKELHDASQAKAADTTNDTAPAYDLGSLSASSDSLVSRADRAADAADAARGAHPAGAANPVRSSSERSNDHGRQGSADPAH
jgi:hypothetical protein